MNDVKATAEDPNASPKSAEPGAVRMVGEIVVLLAAGAAWTALTGVSLTFDATPVPGDGTLFGQLAGIVAAAIGLRVVTLVRRFRKTIGD